MKLFTIALLTLAATSLTAQAAKATCTDAALWVAENQYGNDPMETHIKTVKVGKKYEVTVGIGNAEDGEHKYLVEFNEGTCNPKTADVCEIGTSESCQ